MKSRFAAADVSVNICVHLHHNDYVKMTVIVTAILGVQFDTNRSGTIEPDEFLKMIVRKPWSTMLPADVVDNMPQMVRLTIQISPSVSVLSSRHDACTSTMPA